MSGFAFNPVILTVNSGDTVTFHNADVVPHTATSNGAFDSDSMKQGADWEWVAEGAGKHDYVCNYHPTMKGTITVR